MLFNFFFFFWGGGGGRGGGYGGRGPPPSPGPVEPDKSSLWVDLFSSDSVILVIVTCSNSEFAIFILEDDFSETYIMTSAKKKRFRAFKFETFLREVPTTL